MKTIGNATIEQLEELLKINNDKLKELSMQRWNILIANKVLENKIKEKKE